MERSDGLVVRGARGGEVTAADRALVERAIVELSRIARQGVLGAVVGMGDYLIREFYGGDVEEARDRSPRKPAALRELLARRDELPVSAHALKQAVRLAVQYHALPARVADRLTKTSHEALLPISDPREKLRVAEQAAAGRLNERQLIALVRRSHPPRAGGRKKEPTLARTLDRVVRLLAADEVAAALPATRRLDPTTLRALSVKARRARELLEKIGDSISRATRG